MLDDSLQSFITSRIIPQSQRFASSEDPIDTYHAFNEHGDPDSLPEEERESSVALEEQTERLWKVIVWNDPVNLMSYVVYVLQKLFGFSQEVATHHMLEIHQEGKSIVQLTEQEKGERFVSHLHSYGLQATLEKDE
ncbi:MAG: ATP-dependent Clp protease adapter ClpS [Planctomycetia bacterium]|nr:ATP-dependent Clp protease adapter ClpS [Planctomycetia bacterium]MBL6914630.1 ATP-dependent Clp protease adapter ClpS [Planctomycetota bacterium]MDG1454692.1 ATP-dependent Clp protease adapter ClpS [Planctomycetota bacterium]MDG2085256.1 ATP-dependent Clp protease adapter ClpS [Planctomycetota bacterium]HCW43836.1 ATP-dependent Clp protease adapter ClpS [Planctomycetota bacterium]